MIRKCFVGAFSIVAAIIATNCGRGESSTNNNVADDSMVTVVDTVFVANLSDSLCYDTVFYQAKTSKVDCSIRLDFPKGEASIVTAVRKYIDRQLADLCLSNDEENQSNRVQFTGDLADSDALMAFYAKQNVEWLNGQYDEFAAEEKLVYSYNVEMRKSSEHEKYIVYNTTYDLYCGGPSNQLKQYSVVISKLTGKVLEYTVDSTKIKELQPLLRQGIIRYFKEFEPSVTEEDLFGEDGYINGGGKNIPLPTNNAPVFTDNGVAFHYQSCEIATCMVGDIDFTISYNQIKPYLFPEALALLPVEIFVESAQPDTLCYDTVSYKISASKGKERVSIFLEYPTQDTPLADTVREYINRTLADCFSYSDESDACTKYSGNLNNPNAMMEFYAKRSITKLKKIRKELFVDDCESLWSIAKYYECDKFVCYVTDGWNFFGEDPNNRVTSVLFSKLTNKVIEQTVDRTKGNEMQPLLRKYHLADIRRYGNKNVSEDSLLKERFNFNGELPLPEGTPKFTPEGLKFQYHMYEVQEGCVDFIVPYDEIKPFLLPEARELLD